MASLADLRVRHRGPVIASDDSGYEAARGTFNGMLDRRRLWTMRRRWDASRGKGGRTFSAGSAALDRAGKRENVTSALFSGD
jgi:hypothetical protein